MVYDTEGHLPSLHCEYPRRFVLNCIFVLDSIALSKANSTNFPAWSDRSAISVARLKMEATNVGEHTHKHTNTHKYMTCC